jgi:N utilization substance protein A
VDIKSIAREAGARSKVAVMAMQPGIDPVGACVGMRGVRIQSIVRELNEEKIDVIEWDSDQNSFIAKALSPARVSQVFLEDHPDNGKTAIVIVPDDQLSLAIGREGQNARLAAKLTGWRIDIKSLTEAAQDSLNNKDNKWADPAIVNDEEFIRKVEIVLAKKAANRPITSEDFSILSRMAGAVEGRIVAARAIEFEEINKARVSARKTVPAQAWDVSLAELEISARVVSLLETNRITSLGDILMYFELGDEVLLELSGFGAKALVEVKAAVDGYELIVIETEEPEAVEVVEAAISEDAKAEVGVETAKAEQVIVTGEETVEVIEAEVDLESEKEPKAASGVEVEPVEEIEKPVVKEEEVEPEPEEEVERVPDIDDLGASLVKQKPVKKAKKKQVVIVSSPTPIGPVEEEKRQRSDKQLVLDEKRGEVVAKHKRKKSRQRPEWEDIDDSDEFFTD